MRIIPLVLLLAGCAAPGMIVDIDYSRPPPQDWPRLRERIQYVDKDALRSLCKASPEAHIDGCAIPLFAKSECVIYLSSNVPALLEHEIAHCRGYDHIGAAVFTGRQAWDDYKSRQAQSEWRRRGVAASEAQIRGCEINLQPDVCMRELGYERR